MIDAVSLSVNGANPQKPVSKQTVEVQESSAPPPPQPPSTGAARIRIDNQLNMAIIEYRSNETGDVVRQYPTEAQIQAFSRASELEIRRVAQEPAFEAPDSGGDEAAASDTAEVSTPSFVPSQTADVPDVPATPAAAAPAAAVNVTADGDSVPAYTVSTQSVTA